MVAGLRNLQVFKYVAGYNSRLATGTTELAQESPSAREPSRCRGFCQAVANKQKLKMIFKKSAGGAKFAAHTAFSAIVGEISSSFLLALEFFTRFRGGSFQPITQLSV